MKRLNKILFMIFLALLTTGTVVEANIVEKMESSSVILSQRFKNPNTGDIALYPICSGIVVANEETYSMIFTARHCLSEYPLYVEGYRVTDTLGSNNGDVAILVLMNKIPNKVEVKISKEPLRINQTVFAFGYPKGVKHSSYGKVLDLSMSLKVKIDRELYYIYEDTIMHSSKIKKGCSGGGLFNVEGELVGINVAGGEFSSKGFSEKLSRFINLLKFIGQQ